MIVGGENYEPKEAAFKVSKKAKEHKDHQGYCNYGSDQELVPFSRKMKRGLGKYKGKFPFKCFDYGRVGHFSSKFPYKEKLKRKMTINLETNLKSIRRINSIRKRGYTPKRIVQR